MRHRVKGRKLSRKKAHRKQTLRDLSNALIREHRIVTTLAKAKALRPFFEPLVTRAKEDTQHNRRQVFSTLNNKHTVSKLFEEIGPEAQGRPGGYTRIVRYGYRKGDGAEMAIIELVDYNDIKPEQEQKKKKKTRRAGRNKKTTSAESQESKQDQKSDEESTDQQSDSAETAESQQDSDQDSSESDESTAKKEGGQDAAPEENDESKGQASSDQESSEDAEAESEEASDSEEDEEQESDQDKKQ